MPGHPSTQLAINSRTATRATIRRASKVARNQIRRLDRDALNDLQSSYQRARDDIEQVIRGYADTAGGLRLETMQQLLGQVNGRLQQLELARDQMLFGGIDEAANFGTSPYAGVAGDLVSVSESAARFVRNFVAEDGLQLSDRLWRISQHEQTIVRNSIQNAVIRGTSASKAARDFLERGEKIPADIADKMGLSSAERVARITGSELMTGVGSPLANAKQLFRTEINRAHGEAYMAAGDDVEDFAGWKYLLSPNHPQADICDMHARANVYGLGPGVYPSREKCPWPAHPNTLSFVDIVFLEEVTGEDRAGKEDRLSWLNKQSGPVQEGVLGSRKKRAALQQGILRESEINTPWKVLKAKYERKGINVEELYPKPVATIRQEDIGTIRAEAANYVAEQGERTGFEHAVVYDVNTRAEYFRKTSRSKNSVDFDRHQLAIFHDPRRKLELVHNHPSSGSLSGADLRFGSLPGVYRIVAVGHNGTVYSAQTLTTVEKLAKAHAIISDQLHNYIGPLVNSNKITPEMANALHWHMTNKTLHSLELISYQVKNISGSLLDVLDMMGDDFVEETVLELHNIVDARI